MYERHPVTNQWIQVVAVSNAVAKEKDDVTPAFVRTSASGSTPADTLSFTVANTGAANITFAGIAIKPGETFSETAPPGTKFTAFAYDASGSEAFIVTVGE